jgi:hypothetical protein
MWHLNISDRFFTELIHNVAKSEFSLVFLNLTHVVDPAYWGYNFFDKFFLGCAGGRQDVVVFKKIIIILLY